MASVDFSSLSNDAVVLLLRQRGDRLKFLGAPKRLEGGRPDEYGERKFVESKREEILATVWQELSETFEKLRPAFEKVRPRRVADIGCGTGFIDLMIQRETGASILLIDIEHTDGLWFGFNEKGAGYASLPAAEAFLRSNGVAEVATVNPQEQSLAEAGRVDMAISLLSCGFHYPADTYEAFFREQVDRAILLDMRHRRGALGALSKYGTTSLVWKGRRHEAILVEKG